MKSRKAGEAMAVQTVTLAGKRFVIVPEKQFDQMCRKAALLSSDDAADLADALRRLGDPKEKRIGWARVKKRAGIA